MRNTFLLALFSIFLVDSLAAQSVTVGYAPPAKHAAEFGLTVGYAANYGDVDNRPGFGLGLHYRKAIDYLWSIRVEGNYLSLNGESDDQTVEYSTSVANLGVHGIMSLNNLRYDGPKKTNIYAMFGGGINNISPDVTSSIVADPDSYTKASVQVGLGFAFKINEKFNVAIETMGIRPFGKDLDLVDGVPGNDNDFINYTSVRFNFNIGKKEGVKEPLYWASPFEDVMRDIAELKARPKFDLTDEDEDGVVDMWDEDTSTPKGAAVDAKGNLLDSDGDGVADYKDEEPFSAQGYTVNVKGVAQVPEPDYLNEADVNRIVDAKIKDYDLTSNVKVNWFLPNVNFSNNSYTVARSEYEKLYQIAKVIQDNPQMNFVVRGFTDKTASENYNNVLSYNRAAAAIDHLVNTYQIDRARLLLQWGGESENIIPANKSAVNRRVEIGVAKAGDAEMSKPEGPDAGVGTFKGNKTGY
ncbi:MAG: OmpA family protein [Bacteroidota bacterium]